MKLVALNNLGDTYDNLAKNLIWLTSYIESIATVIESTWCVAASLIWIIANITKYFIFLLN